MPVPSTHQICVPRNPKERLLTYHAIYHKSDYCPCSDPELFGGSLGNNGIWDVLRSDVKDCIVDAASIISCYHWYIRSRV